MWLWIENLLEAVRTGFWAIPLFAILLALVSAASTRALAFDQIIDAADDHPAVNTCLQLRLTSLIELDVDRVNASVVHARLGRLGQRSDVADASRV